MNEKKGFFLFRSKVIASIQVIISALAAFYVIKFNSLPSKYLIMFLGTLLLVTLLTVLLVLKTDEPSNKNVLSKILSSIISLALLVGTLYLVRGDSFIKDVTGASKDTHVVSVVVLKDKPYETLADVENEFIFGANDRMDAKNIKKALDSLEKDGHDIEIQSYDTYEDLSKALRSGEREVILLSEAHRALMKEYDEHFDDDTKVIHSIKYEEEVKIVDKNTNVKSDTFSFFITGIDTYGPVSTVSRSDVNMIMTVSPKTNQILLTSIPRDYHVELASFGAYDKLTHAGIYGVGESVATLENLLNIDIDYYVRVNFSSVEQIVDSLGGVDVYSRYTFSADGYSYVEGMNHMNGPMALRFVRERYQLPEGDLDRVRNQQALMTGMIKKAMSPTIITNYNSILSSVSGSFEMSMPDSDLKKLVKMQLDTGADWDVMQIQLTGYGSNSTTTYSMPGWNLYVMEPNYDTVNYASSLIHQMENGEVISVD
ncbi:MAG TPA: LCP family protein [Erysipelothrix sp.]